MARLLRHPLDAARVCAAPGCPSAGRPVEHVYSYSQVLETETGALAEVRSVRCSTCGSHRFVDPEPRVGVRDGTVTDRREFEWTRRLTGIEKAIRAGGLTFEAHRALVDEAEAIVRAEDERRRKAAELELVRAKLSGRAA